MTWVRTRPASVAALALVLALLVAVVACSGTAPTGSRPRAAGATPTPRPAALHVVGLGDSVMAGTACGCAGIVREYAARLRQRTGRPVRSSDHSDNGLVTGDLLHDLDGDAAQRASLRAADVVLVTIGANDLVPELRRWQTDRCDETCYRTPAHEMGVNLGRVLDRVEALVPGHAQVLVTDYWNVFTDGEMTRRTAGQAQIDFSEDVTAVADDAICAAVRRHRATCVDLVAPFKGSLDRSAGARRDPTPLLADDGDHPNAAGTTVIVRALMAATHLP